MKKKELKAIAQAAAKNIKTETDLNEFHQMLTKISVETALSAEKDVNAGARAGNADAETGYPVDRSNAEAVSVHYNG